LGSEQGKIGVQRTQYAADKIVGRQHAVMAIDLSGAYAHGDGDRGAAKNGEQ
jgi:hypothetical protein